MNKINLIKYTSDIGDTKHTAVKKFQEWNNINELF